MTPTSWGGADDALEGGSTSWQPRRRPGRRRSRKCAPFRSTAGPDRLSKLCEVGFFAGNSRRLRRSGSTIESRSRSRSSLRDSNSLSTLRKPILSTTKPLQRRGNSALLQNSRHRRETRRVLGRDRSLTQHQINVQAPLPITYPEFPNHRNSHVLSFLRDCFHFPTNSIPLPPHT